MRNPRQEPDDDHDGKINEDGPDDLDGDGKRGEDSEQGFDLNRNFPGDGEIVQVISLNEKLPFNEPKQGFRNVPKPGIGKETEFWLKGNDTQTFRYLIKKGGGKGWIEAEIISERGGKDKKRLTIEG